MQQQPAQVNATSVEAIAQLRAGDERILEYWYDQHRAEFLSWANGRFYAGPSYLEDAWQEAATVFYERVKSGKLTELHCSVKTFLFAVGSKWLLKNRRKTKRILWKSSLDKEIERIQFDFDDTWEEERVLLRSAMKGLSTKCQLMLTERHFDDLTIPELMEKYGTNANNINSSLSQCLAKLKAIIKEKSLK